MGDSRRVLLDMFRAWLSPQTLLQAIEPVIALVDEAHVEFGTGGIRLTTVDAPLVGAVSLELLEDAFHDYESDGTTIFLDLDRLHSIVRETENLGELLIELDEENHDLIVDIGGYDFDFTLMSSDVSTSSFDPREIDGPAEVVVESDEPTRAIRLASMFSEQVRMGIDRNNEAFYLNAKGDNDSMHLSLEGDDLVSITPAKAFGTYSLDYLSNMARAMPPETEIHFEMGQEQPLKFQYEFANGNGRVTYGLAPRLES